MVKILLRSDQRLDGSEPRDKTFTLKGPALEAKNSFGTAEDLAPHTVNGQPRLWLRLEGLAILGTAVFTYANLRSSWPLFAILFLTPDLGMIGYLAGPRVGAVCYNVVHTYVFPLALGLILYRTGHSLSIPLIWLAHIAFDRAMGYGLKYDEGFGHTHLMTIGKKEPQP